MTALDPELIVDREPEVQRFEALLSCVSERRVLAVSDDSGWGKSTFLRKLQFLCDFTYGVPAALVPFDELDDNPDEFTLVSDIVKQLKAAKLGFPVFSRLSGARAFQDVGHFVEAYQQVSGTIDASGATARDSAQMAGMIVNYAIEHAENVRYPSWNDDADREARDLCVDAFFADLTLVVRERTVVLIFDTVDQATEQLQRLVFLQLLRRSVFAAPGQKHHLVVVLAGTKLETRLRAMFQDIYETGFDSIPELGSWDLEDTSRLFEVHGYAGLKPSVVEMLHNGIVERDLSLTSALGIADIYSRGNR